MLPKKRQRLSISDETNQNMLKKRGSLVETKNQRKTRYRSCFIVGPRNLQKINLVNELDYFKLFWTKDILEHKSNGTSNKKFKDGGDMGDSKHLRYLFSHKHRKCTQAVFLSLPKISVPNA
jgi:hypothetical protein